MGSRLVLPWPGARSDIAVGAIALGLSGAVAWLGPLSVGFKILLGLALIGGGAGWILLRARSVPPSVGFPTAACRQIEAALPHEAISLFQQGLRPAFDACYGYQPPASQATFVTAITATLTERLQRLTQAETRYTCLEDRHRDHALIALIVYVSLIETMSDRVPTQVFDQPILPERTIMPLLCLSAVLPWLGQEQYRLYELGGLNASPPGSLRLNADIQSGLEAALQPSTQSTVEPAAPAAPANTVESAAPLAEPNAAVAPEAAPTHPSKADTADTPPPSTVDDALTDAVARYMPWLAGHVSRKRLNAPQSEFYTDPNVADGALWQTEALLAQYAYMTSIDLATLLPALQQAHCLTTARAVYVEEETEVPLYAVAKVTFPLPETEPLSGTILEKADETDL